MRPRDPSCLNCRQRTSGDCGQHAQNYSVWPWVTPPPNFMDNSRIDAILVRLERLERELAELKEGFHLTFHPTVR